MQSNTTPTAVSADQDVALAGVHAWRLAAAAAILMLGKFITRFEPTPALLTVPLALAVAYAGLRVRPSRIIANALLAFTAAAFGIFGLLTFVI